jgi:hypothetical protein
VLKISKCTFLGIQHLRQLFWWTIKIRCNHFNLIISKDDLNFELIFFKIDSFLPLLEFLSPLRKLIKI